MIMWPAFKRWFPLAIALTGVCGLIYMSVQQEYRQSLNDPQIQLARDSAAQMERDGSAIFLENWDRIDIHESVAPFVAVYDKNGTAIVSSGVLRGSLPQPPKGVFEAAKASGENRVTWQPELGVRIATVIRPIPGSDGFVLAGRNMSEVEKRIKGMTTNLFAGWMVLLLLTLGAQFLLEKLRFPREQ